MALIHLDKYCERGMDPHFWAEPINAITNLAFVTAAVMALRHIRLIPLHKAPDLYGLCIILACIGIGSWAWHVVPTHTTLMMDVLPIVLFINIYLVSFLWRAFRWKWWQVFIGFLALQAMNALSGKYFPPSFLHGTIIYLPTYLVLVAICIKSYIRKDSFSFHLFLITSIWTTSLIFRTIDIPLCHVTHLGTHYFWHIANALVLYNLLLLLSRFIRQKS